MPIPRTNTPSELGIGRGEGLAMVTPPQTTGTRRCPPSPSRKFDGRGKQGWKKPPSRKLFGGEEGESELAVGSKRKRSSSMRDEGDENAKRNRPLELEPVTNSDFMSRIQSILKTAPSDHFAKNYEFLGEIGKGSFGSVDRCKHVNDRRVYAIKRIPLPHTPKRRDFREVEALSDIEGHSNVVKYYDSWVEREQLFIKLEFCEGGSLLQFIENEQSLSELELLRIVQQVASGLAYVHTNQYIHMDVKPANIFYKGTVRKTYKIGDFGVAVKANTLNNGDDGTWSRSGGDGRYVAPEVLDGKPLPASDIFSLGMSLYELACHKRLPRSGAEEFSVLRKNMDMSPLKTYSEAFRALITDMTSADFIKRPSAREVHDRAKRILDNVMGSTLAGRLG
eukprot:CAMPEP_0119154496 /NCGR_PEP_ID=MMETSP1310-20130426/50871_1 /TAXON_ID=464262 /ORGANISM="Genus nov. species nov., Strain RCC2339" /LENGTH=392 /DNA_ID=CAMNT_0007147031 /DNA_START=215 /DNA_END=1389 /DNA_ORIENTATION=+